MLFSRPCLLLLLASWWVGAGLQAQETEGGTTSSGSSTTGGSTSTAPASGTDTPGTGFGAPSSSFGSPVTPSVGTPAAEPPNPYSFTSPSNASTTPPGAAGAGGTTSPAGAGTSGFGTGAGGASSVPAEQTFTVPAAYGQATQTLSGGRGGISRPRFRYGTSLSVGFDDNVLSTPTNGIGQPEVRQEVLVEDAQPARVEFRYLSDPQLVAANGGKRYQRVIVPGTNPKFRNVVVVPRVDAPSRISSPAVRAGGSASIQFADRRTLFTLNAGLSATEYFNRPGDQFDYNGHLSLVLVRRLTSRAQLSATANVAYLSQPDVSRLNSPINNQGDYFTGVTKLDLSYLWTKRFSTVTSASIGSTIYTSSGISDGSFYEVTVGNEARLVVTPRVTALLEVRASTDRYPSAPLRDSNSLFLLTGTELNFSSRMNVALRLGEQLRSFSEAGDSASSPYVETALNYRYSRTGQVAWTTRIGFEEASTAGVSTQVFRTGLSVVQAFSSRLRGTAQISALHRINDFTQGGESTTDNILQLDLGLEYALTRRCSLSANYSLLDSTSSIQGSDYYRNQFFLGVDYAF